MATTDPTKLPGPAVEPSQAQGAQIPLQTFTLPNFPPSAGGLKALTLTSDINVSEYQSELSKPYSIPERLPPQLESLTLELFSLGFPAGFLSELAKKLPNLKSVVLYSQLFAGISDASQKDAVEFFKLLPGLRALHLLDVFAKPHFFADAAQWLKYSTSEVPGEARRGLMFLEVNYTFRHEDEEFMGKIMARELPELIGPGCVSVTLNVAAPEKSEDPDDPVNIRSGGGGDDEDGVGSKEGVMAFNKSLAEVLVQALTREESWPRGLKALNCTLYTMTTKDLKTVLAKNKGVMLLNCTVEVEPGEECKKELLAALQQCANLEQVEIVANPSLQFFMAMQNPRSGVLSKTFPSAEDMEALSGKCSKLASFKANVLRTTSLGTVEWERKDGMWIGGVKEGKGVAQGS